MIAIAAKMCAVFVISFFLLEATPYTLGNMALAGALPLYTYTTIHLSGRHRVRPRR